MKLTPWFGNDTKPTRPGVYEVGFLATHLGGEYAYWNGSAWGWASSTPKQANRCRRTDGSSQSKYWRGLLTEGAKR